MKNIGYIAYQLRELMKQNAIASAFTDPHNPDDFIAGYVRAVNGRTVLIQSVGPFGRYDGWFAIRLTCVIEVQLDAAYAERLERLLKIHGQSEKQMPDEAQDWAEADHIGAILRHAQANDRVVTVWTRDEAYTGFVQQVDDLRVSMDLLDFMGQRCATQALALMDLELCSLDSEEERMYELLNQPR